MLDREEQAHPIGEDTSPDTLASVSLTDIMKQAQASADMAALLDSIPGALEAHQKGREDIEAGSFVTLEELSTEDIEDILPGGSGPITVTVEDIMEVTGLSREHAQGLMEGVLQAARGEAREQPDLLRAIEDVLEDEEDLFPKTTAEPSGSNLSPDEQPRKIRSPGRGRNTPEQVAAAKARAKAYFASEPEEADEREQALRGAMNLLKQRNSFPEEAAIDQEMQNLSEQRLAAGASRRVDLDEIAASFGYAPADYRQVD